MAKARLDASLVDLGLAESREKAKRYIMAGQVRVNGHVVSKPAAPVQADDQIELKSSSRFVSRGGDKLMGAVDAFGFAVDGMVCMDVGASTGGFTDCMLQHGATRVFAIDVGKAQLHWKLREDERVIVMESFNARYLKPEDLDEVPARCTIDVSFISLTRILPPVTEVLAKGGEIISLIKPQFEAGKDQVGKGGVVRDESVHQAVVEKIRDFGQNECGLEWLGVEPSPLKGPSGNIEFLGYWRKV